MSVLAAILLASTSLHITVWPNGQGHPGGKTYTFEVDAPPGLAVLRASGPLRAVVVRRFSRA